MSGTTHILIGTASAICVAKPSTRQELITVTILGALGGMIADIDTDNSKISHYFRTGLVLILILGILEMKYNFIDYCYIDSIFKFISGHEKTLIGLLLFLILLFAGTFTKHRRITHSIEYTLLLCLCMFFIHPSFVFPFSIGLISHILLDLLNYKKVRVSILFNINFALKLCNSNGVINVLLTTVGLIAMYLLTALRYIK